MNHNYNHPTNSVKTPYKSKYQKFVKIAVSQHFKMKTFLDQYVGIRFLTLGVNMIVHM